MFRSQAILAAGILAAALLSACASGEPEKDPIFDVTGQEQQQERRQQ